MKFLFEFLPIVLFFIAFKIKGIYYATAIAIIVSICQILFAWARKRPIEPMMWISLVILLLFGGSTLLLHNEWFIKWKPTILYWIFSLIILISQFGFKKNIIQKLLSKQIQMPDKIWKRLNLGWGLFFCILGAVNLFVAYHFSTDIWVNFKLFGILGLILIFGIIQSIFIAPFLDKTSEYREP